MAKLEGILLAVLFFIAGLGIYPPSANAQALSCTANAAVPPTVRAEGISEFVADIVLDCTGGVPTANLNFVPGVNITIFFNTAVTSRVLADTGTTKWSEALLLLDEPGSGGNPTQAPCQSSSGICISSGNGTGRSPNYYVGQGSGTNKNVFQGISNGNQIIFLNVPVDAPGAGQHRVFRFTNLRVNASAIAGGAGGTPGTVQALISASGAISMPISNPTLLVAFVQRGASTSLHNAESTQLLTPLSLPQCESQSNLKVATLRFTENFPAALKKRNIGTSASLPWALANQNTPGTIYNTESGLFNGAWGGNIGRGILAEAGLADWGTRFAARFGGIPEGVAIYADINSTSSAGGSSDLAQMTLGETDGFSPVALSSTGPAGTARIPVNSGYGAAFWEVTQTDPLDTGYHEMGLYINYSAGSAGSGTITVEQGLAPLGSVAQALVSDIPRYVDYSSAAQLVNIVPCTPTPTVTPTATPTATPFLAFEATAKARQRVLAQRALIVTVTCPTGCQASLSGEISIAGSSKKRSLKRVTKVLSSAAPKRISIPVTSSLINSISTAFAKKKRVSAVMEVTATGNGLTGVKNVSVVLIR